MNKYEYEHFYQQEMLKPELIDSLLTQEGLKQCAEKVSELSAHDFDDTVYVSPLRRTIQTACLLVKDHPNRANLKIKLDPLIKENMSYQNTFLAQKTPLIQFCEQMCSENGVSIDTSSLESYGEFWFWESHPNKEIAKKLLSFVDQEALTTPNTEEYTMSVFEKVK